MRPRAAPPPPGRRPAARTGTGATPTRRPWRRPGGLAAGYSPSADRWRPPCSHVHNMRVQASHSRIRPDLQQAGVNPLELYFDLVFVFALTQVTAFMAADLSWHGLLRGVLVISL